MFPKRQPQQDEMHCTYDGIEYSKVPGYRDGYGCSVCKGISAHHLPIKKQGDLESDLGSDLGGYIIPDTKSREIMGELLNKHKNKASG